MKFYIKEHGTFEIDGLIEFETAKTISGKKCGFLDVIGEGKKMRITIEAEKLNMLVTKRRTVTRGYLLHADEIESVEIRRL